MSHIIDVSVLFMLSLEYVLFLFREFLQSAASTVVLLTTAKEKGLISQL